MYKNTIVRGGDARRNGRNNKQRKRNCALIFENYFIPLHKLKKSKNYG